MRGADASAYPETLEIRHVKLNFRGDAADRSALPRQEKESLQGGCCRSNVITRPVASPFGPPSPMSPAFNADRRPR
jgi:hypothetical protein